jgi:ubiquinone/menaquinone biosynthesis C-methylase UbiE
MTSLVVQANIDVHTRMVDSYETEPHFRPENQAKVRRNLEQLRQRAPGDMLLDLGCGTGFILRLARDLFRELHGVDVTPAMLARVDTSSGNIHLHNCQAEKVPFPDNTFDVVTAYSFLHHLEDYRSVLKEAQRVLKPGGLLYADLEPNKLFWERLEALRDVPAANLHPWVRQAREAVLETDAKVEKTFGIPAETFRQAEYSKSILGGIDSRTLPAETRALGYSRCEVQLEWHAGQAQVMHGQSFEAAEIIDRYLHAMAPLTDHLFKYVRFILTK